MKKITLSVAALAIAISSFGQCTSGDEYQEQVKKFNSFEYQMLDLISAVKMDMYYGFLSQDKGTYYINQMTTLIIANRQMLAELNKDKYVKL